MGKMFIINIFNEYLNNAGTFIAKSAKWNIQKCESQTKYTAIWLICLH